MAEPTETIALTAGIESGREPVAVPQQLGPYRFIRQLGVGGMGEVWLARDTALEREVAVKFLLGVREASDAATNLLLAGVRSVCAITHPNIVTVHAADVYNGVPYIVMQHVDGPDLRQIIKRTTPLPPALAVSVMCRIAEGVSALHDEGIVHRDIKPANVMVAGDGRLLVTDFGLSCERKAGGRAGFVAGSPAYMAPEAWEGDASLRTDVYAMGATLFELLTGETPYKGDVDSVEASHRAGSPPLDRIEAIDPELAEIIGRAMRTSVVYRYKDASHLAAAIREAKPADAESDPGPRLIERMRGGPAQVTTPGENESDRTPSSDYYTVLRTLARKSKPPEPNEAGEGGSPKQSQQQPAAAPPPSQRPTEDEDNQYLHGIWITLIVVMVVVFLAAAIAAIVIPRIL